MGSTVYPRNRITGVILAGGRARRMGGQDKGLLTFAHKAFACQTLAEHIAAILSPQVGRLIINANRNTEIYGCLGHPVVPDAVGDYLGPLAGMASAMQVANTPYVATVPCDSPFVPPDLVERLYTAVETARAEIGVAHDGVRLQPVFALLRSALWGSIVDFLKGGDRKIDLWYARHKTALADFSDKPDMFFNINTLSDMNYFASG
uniref:Molybdenum cofactor guanylyltransferase n=1 Tax=Candidatus Kentrum eta TaxID=2126337 RepID=A0A450UWY0_9GAMM|nr:MAG: molybdopterin-guanine dinucleotide biosynthesis protein A [Candidatus Kentron sp. H]VFJ97048.1 MAG: molybdopterin-guanine dinucleotide biosynthesis protein A [Candidatus Kentron sp. H]VFK02775.1 MAG: molybdopterin-guanine dinucleotide biosynthesis protein A [Candidatus Kentron sp. H]